MNMDWTIVSVPNATTFCCVLNWYISDKVYFNTFWLLVMFNCLLRELCIIQWNENDVFSLRDMAEHFSCIMFNLIYQNENNSIFLWDMARHFSCIHVAFNNKRWSLHLNKRVIKKFSTNSARNWKLKAWQTFAMSLKFYAVSSYSQGWTYDRC